MPRPQDPDFPSPSRGSRKGDPERLAVGSALYHDRRVVVTGGWLIALLSIALLYIGVTYRSDTAGPVNLAAWTALAALSVVMAVLLQRASREQFYTVILVWVSLIHLGIVAQLTNFYFGVERKLILQGTSPVLMLAVPVALVGARALLKGPDANRLNFLTLLALSIMTLVHALLFWSEAETLYAMLLMMATVMVAGPLVELMMRQHFRVQSIAQQTLRAALAEAQHQANEARRQSLLDPLTGLLNRSGVHESLEASMAEHGTTGLARLSITNLASLRESMQDRDIDTLLKDFAQALRLEAGACRVGRMDGGNFDLWGPWIQGEKAWDEHCRELARRLEARFETLPTPLRLSCASGVFTRLTAPQIALEEISFRSFMNTVRG